jgi:hypothetical protein
MSIKKLSYINVSDISKYFKITENDKIELLCKITGCHTDWIESYQENLYMIANKEDILRANPGNIHIELSMGEIIDEYIFRVDKYSRFRFDMIKTVQNHMKIIDLDFFQKTISAQYLTDVLTLLNEMRLYNFHRQTDYFYDFHKYVNCKTDCPCFYIMHDSDGMLGLFPCGDESYGQYVKRIFRSRYCEKHKFLFVD